MSKVRFVSPRRAHNIDWWRKDNNHKSSYCVHLRDKLLVPQRIQFQVSCRGQSLPQFGRTLGEAMWWFPVILCIVRAVSEKDGLENFTMHDENAPIHRITAHT